MHIGLAVRERYDELTDEVYRSGELEPEEIVEQDLTELIQEANSECLTEFQDMLNKKMIDFPTNYKLECIFDQMKVADYTAFEKELKETLRGY